MESELERFHKQNTQLELNITELRQKLKATEKEMHGERQRVRDVEAVVRRFKTDLHNCVGYIQDPKLLKESIRALYQKHVQEDIVSSLLDNFVFVQVVYLGENAVADLGGVRIRRALPPLRTKISLLS